MLFIEGRKTLFYSVRDQPALPRVHGAEEASLPTLDLQRVGLCAVGGDQQIIVRAFGPKHTARHPGGVIGCVYHPAGPLGRLASNLRHYILCLNADNISESRQITLSA